MNATGHFLLSWWKHFHSWPVTQQSPGLASASLPCGPSPSTPVTTHWPPSRSFPLLTPSSLPWQAQLCPCLLLRLQIGLTDSHIYIPGLGLTSDSTGLYSVPTELRCQSHLDWFKDLSTQYILSQTLDRCLCLVLWPGPLKQPPTWPTHVHSCLL